MDITIRSERDVMLCCESEKRKDARDPIVHKTRMEDDKMLGIDTLYFN